MEDNKTVPSLKALNGRLEYFCSRDARLQADLYDFIYNVFEGCKPYIFGGVIRDVGMHSKWGFFSDVDIVYTGYLDYTKLPQETKQNKFGGFRVRHKKWLIDFWRAEETWACAQNIVPYTSIKSLLNTTTTNLESALYDIYEKKIICGNNYIKDLNDRHLYIINPYTPNTFKTLEKIILTIYKNNIISCDINVIHYIRKTFKETSNNEMENFISNQPKSVREVTKRLSSMALSDNIDLLPVNIELPLRDQHRFFL